MPLQSQLQRGQMGLNTMQPTRNVIPGPASVRPVQQLAARSLQQLHAAPADAAVSVDQTLNPLVASLSVSKTMALTDLARSMKESGIDVSAAQPCFVRLCQYRQRRW